MESFFVDVLTTIPQMAIAGWIIGVYIRSKPVWLYPLLHVLASIVIYLCTSSLLLQSYALRGLFSVMVQIILVLLFSRIPKTHGVLFVLLADTFMFVMELVVEYGIFYLYPDFVSMANLPVYSVVAWKLAFIPLLVVSHFVPFWFCRRFFKTDGNSEISKYLPFIIIQVFLVLIPMIMAIAYTDNYVYIATLCMIYLLANFSLDLLLMHTFKKINRAHAAELQNEQTQNMLQVQLNYYHQVQDNARVLQQLRHDMSNQLQTLSILLDHGELETAQTQLSSFREDIGRTGKNRYTGNPVVDAVIESKIRSCSDEGIVLECSGTLPTDLNIRAVNLCSIAANLLDNAIHACKSLNSDQMPKICFAVSVQEERMIFSCENPVPPGFRLNEKEPELDQEHGWGLSILRSIANDYGGSLEIQQLDGIVKIVLWMLPKPLK